MQDHPVPSSLFQRDSDIKHLVELLCDRMYWYMQRDKQDKNLKKMRAELERCRYPESSNHSEVLKLQIDQWEKEKTKSCNRLSGTDGKLINHLAAFIDRRSRERPSKHGNAIRSEDVDARLNALQKALDAKFSACLEEAFTQIVNDNQLQLRKETEGLKIGLEEERQKSARLQKHIEELEQRLGSLDKRLPSFTEETLEDKSASLRSDGKLTELESKLNQLSKKMDDLATNMITSQALSGELGRFDTVVSAFENPKGLEDWGSSPEDAEAGMRTRRRLENVADEMHIMKLSLQCESVEGAPQSIAGLHKRLDSCMEMIHINSKEQMSTSQAVKAIQDALRLTLPAQTNDGGQRFPAKLASTHKTEIEEIFCQKVQPLSASLSQELKGMMQQKLTKVAHDLGSFIDKERIARESATAKAGQSLAEVSALRRDVGVLKDSVSTSVDKLDQKIGEQCKLVTSWCERLSSLDSGLQRVSKEAETNVQKLELQLQTVSAWQRNFTTKDLYRDIIKHITNNLPPGPLQNISSLTTRLETIEALLNNSSGDGAPKKRKAAHK
ncbi:hypothetical protein J3459_011501 [Metarhizium acridum]|nr:hypothetical protein J3459_011501 [Metarhizium acridum]